MLTLVCSNCSTKQDASSRFCDSCGSPLMTMGQDLVKSKSHRRIVIGTDEACDLILKQETVSRRHAIIEVCEGFAKIADLGSSNGTFVNGRRIGGDGVDVNQKDHIRLGIYELQLDSVLSLRQTGGSPQSKAKALILGRAPDCDVVIDNPLVSAHHARAVPNQGGFILEDLRSSNGTFVNGKRIRSPIQISSNDKVSLGAVSVFIDQKLKTVRARQLRGSIDVEAIRVRRSILLSDGRPKEILSEMSFKIEAGELVAVMGPSGAGKSTLLMALSGFEPPSSGQVRINSADLYENFAHFRSLIGFVPQDDVLHAELTVREAIEYSARLRLPEDTNENEIRRRVMQILQELRLFDISDIQIGSPSDKIISGGQRKRVNLAMELVGDPELIFLDEPTSGLSSQDASEVIAVLKDLTQSGRTIILTIHQPSQEIFESMSKVVLLAKGGKLAFVGETSSDVYRFFEVDSRTPEAIMRALESRPADEWASRFQSSEYSRSPSAALATPIEQPKFSLASHKANLRLEVSKVRQLLVLLSRYTVTKIRDRSNLIFMALQAPVVGVMLAVLFGEGRNDHSARDIPIFIMGIAVLFFGTFNASREVVREKSIFLRERLVFLRTLPYLLSKFLFLAAINSVQCLIMTLFLKGFIGAEGHFVEYLITLLITGCSAIGLGLLISTIVRTAETAMAIVPIVIIINIVLAGFLKPLNSKNQEYVGLLASPVIARWSTEALMEVERRGLSTLVVNAQPSGCDYVGESPRAVEWCALRVQAAKGLEPKRLTVDFAVILGFNLIALALGYFRLRIGSRGD